MAKGPCFQIKQDKFSREVFVNNERYKNRDKVEQPRKIIREETRKATGG